MVLNDIFQKPINRQIEGVIKADDEENLLIEFEEYVLTNEVAKRLEQFLDAYNNYEGANGAWISGFFGSGKSHLLKILALLLENRSVDGTPALDIFLPKCGDNEILRGDLSRAVSIPSKSILFNIDQKADIISKTQIDALLSVFVKVFDETCGYYGKQGHIARFERDLDNRGIYEAFKQTYRELSGLAWEKGREQALLESANISKAYATVAGVAEESAKGIIDKYRSEYKVSIEDFAQQIHDYISKQGPNFRLNFFVDEVGQYIAGNIKLMTNLQTIAESLATKCRGQAWIIITAQEDMNTVIGEMGKQQSNDFSKIQDRFANRMKLTSADVAEVIQKRLLQKNEQGIASLSELFHRQVNNFNTLFSFTDGAPTYRTFRDRDHFIQSYPFVPYQYILFQSSIQNLSLHNAFEGKHSSVGERSMLGVFQQVAKHISGCGIGDLATFDLMYEGIRSVLKTQIQRSVITAEGQLDNPLAIRALKALLLVKYVKEFKATIRNLSVLLLDGFERDIPSFQKNLEEALNMLEQQSYIQRTGELYEYLTDEEKDVEQEIKNTHVENQDITDELSKIVFEYTLKTTKIRYEENGQDYPFTRRLDDRTYGREHELAINVITPFHESAGNEDLFKMLSMKGDALFVLLPSDERLMRDVMLFKRTEKYIKQNITIAQQESVKRILSDKSHQNREREKDLRDRVHQLLGKARLITCGSEIELSCSEPQARVAKGFHELIQRAYPNLRMLRGTRYSMDDIGTIMAQGAGTLFADDEMMISEAEQEMLALIKTNSLSGKRTTLKDLVDAFERKPNGWYLAAILCIATKLAVRNKIEARSDSNLLEGEDFVHAVKNTHAHPNIILEPQSDFSASQVRQLKEFYADFFDSPPKANEAKPLGQETAEAFGRLVDELEGLSNQKGTYSFLSALEPLTAKIRMYPGKHYSFFLTDFRQHADDLLDSKEQVLDPIRRFLGGPQRAIYDEAKALVQEQGPNLAYIEGDEARILKEIVESDSCYRSNQMQKAKECMEEIKAKVSARLSHERQLACERTRKCIGRIAELYEFQRLDASQQGLLTMPFEAMIKSFETATMIALIRDQLHSLEHTQYQGAISQLNEWVREKSETKQGDSKVKEEFRDYIDSRTIQVDYSKPTLETEDDLDDYLKALREAFLKEIKAKRRIQIG